MAALKTKERQVLQACKAVLNVLKDVKLLDYWRITTGGKLYAGRTLLPNIEMVGFSDIIILAKGVPHIIFVELKATDGKQSDRQKEFQQRVETMGHKYYLCHGAEELCQILDQNGVKTNLYFR